MVAFTGLHHRRPCAESGLPGAACTLHPPFDRWVTGHLDRSVLVAAILGIAALLSIHLLLRTFTE